jgi:hypothetical protein
MEGLFTINLTIQYFGLKLPYNEHSHFSLYDLHVLSAAGIASAASSTWQRLK